MAAPPVNMVSFASDEHFGFAVSGFCLAVLSLCWQAFTWLVDQRRSILVRQIGNTITDRTFVTPGSGPTIYVLSVAITNESRRRPAVISSFALRPTWSSTVLEAIADPRETDSTASEYVLPTTSLTYPRDIVLDHRLNNDGELPVGKSLSGILLFKGYESLPINMLHGTFVWVTLVVRLHGGASFSERCWLRADRGVDGVTWPPFGK